MMHAVTAPVDDTMPTFLAYNTLHYNTLQSIHYNTAAHSAEPSSDDFISFQFPLIQNVMKRPCVSKMASVIQMLILMSAYVQETQN